MAVLNYREKHFNRLETSINVSAVRILTAVFSRKNSHGGFLKNVVRMALVGTLEC